MHYTPCTSPHSADEILHSTCPTLWHLSSCLATACLGIQRVNPPASTATVCTQHKTNTELLHKSRASTNPQAPALNNLRQPASSAPTCPATSVSRTELHLAHITGLSFTARKPIWRMSNSQQTTTTRPAGSGATRCRLRLPTPSYASSKGQGAPACMVLHPPLHPPPRRNLALSCSLPLLILTP